MEQNKAINFKKIFFVSSSFLSLLVIIAALLMRGTFSQIKLGNMTFNQLYELFKAFLPFITFLHIIYYLLMILVLLLTICGLYHFIKYRQPVVLIQTLYHGSFSALYIISIKGEIALYNVLSIIKTIFVDHKTTGQTQILNIYNQLDDILSFDNNMLYIFYMSIFIIIYNIFLLLISNKIVTIKGIDYNFNDNRPLPFLKGKKGLAILFIVCLSLVSYTGYHLWLNYFDKSTIDISSHMTMTFAGKNGEGHFEMKNNPIYNQKNKVVTEFINSIKYDYSKEDGTLSNGDSIKVTAVYNKEEAKILKIKLKNTEKTFIVQGLSYNFKNASESLKSTLKDIKKEAEKKLNSEYISNEYDNYSYSYYGSYYSYTNDHKSDQVYLIYRIKEVETSSDNDETRTSYSYVYVSVSPVDSQFKENSKKDGISYNIGTISDNDIITEKMIMDKIKSGNMSIEKIKE
ncbi:hypothetical protein [Eggerthia catenaformis]|uniref:hypothetical protein n=1 Tax=Eggerthia catenaformis TaxID=31973 RepID=UPI00248EE0BE|nr:hypothetical protein [Eggerthia catenaformis]